MIAIINLASQNIQVDLSKPLDLSLPLQKNSVKAWYINDLEINPVINDLFTGNVALGGNVNFNNIFFNPHAHGTHTECVGHISKEFNSINKTLTNFHFLAYVCTITPEHQPNGDYKIQAHQIQQLNTSLNLDNAKALIIRTTPNLNTKKNKNYSNTNPPYLSVACADILKEKNIDHLLIDLPSVDRESDNGKLAMHHAFWNYPNNLNNLKTITELIFVDNSISDGFYLLNLQIASFENDASPSKPVIYKVL